MSAYTYTVRTGHAGGHERGEHEEEHAEEQTSGVVVDLGRRVADVHVQHADQYADRQVRDEPQPRQRLHTATQPFSYQLQSAHYRPTPSTVTTFTGFGWGKGGNVTSAGWQVTLCDPIWHVSSCSGEASC